MVSDCRIMVVEDEALIAQDLENLLERAGYEVVSKVASGEGAIEAIENSHPNLVLMDIRLNGEKSGIEAADEIRKKYDLPIIFLTAYADKNTLSQAKDAMPYGYVVKPFRNEELLANVEMAINKHLFDKVLKEENKLFHQIADNIDDILWIMTSDGQRIIYANPSFERVFGMKSDYLGHRYSWFAFVHPDDYKDVLNNFLNEMKFGTPLNMEYRIIRLDHSIRWIKVKAFQIFGTVGDSNFIVGIASDITEQKRQASG